MHRNLRRIEILSVWIGSLALGLSSTANADVQREVTRPAPPVLTHSAPRLGSLLELTVSDATPGANVTLYFSTGGDSRSTPFGVLELDPSALTLVGDVLADANGVATFHVPLPGGRTFAERELHYQALIDDGAALGGRRLSRAAHMRALGSRLYLGVEEMDGSATDRGLLVTSAVSDADLFYIPTDHVPDDVPVFSSNGSRGATARFVFDNFFGGLLYELPTAGAFSDTLFVDVAGTGFYRLFDGSVEHIEFATGDLLDSTPVPTGANSTQWALNDEQTEAFFVGSTGTQPVIHRMDLATGADLGAVPIGIVSANTQYVTFIEWTGERLVVRTQELNGFGMPASATLERIDISGPVSVDTTTLFPFNNGVVPLPDEDVVLVWRNSHELGVPAYSYEMIAVPLSTGGASTVVPGPALPNPPASIYTFLATPFADGSQMWVRQACTGDGENGDGGIYVLDASIGAWSNSLRNFICPAPHEGVPDFLVVVDDAFGERVYAPSAYDFPFSLPPGFLRVYDLPAFGEVVQPHSLVAPYFYHMAHAESVDSGPAYAEVRGRHDR